ncbi:MAG TPA: MFS transporter [Candidatus Acidoferrales bacterium]|nr:MFS transporter [Candidatus Acidoferrales bacterium]
MKVPARYVILTVTLVLQTSASLLQQGIGAIQPLIGARLHLDHQHLGWVVAAISLGSATFATGAGLAVDYFGERAVLLWSGIAMGTALLAAALFPNLIWLVVWLFLFGMAYGTSAPSGGRAILQWFTRDRGFAMGIRQCGVPLGGVVGSLLLPVVALHWGYQAALAVSGVICIVVAVVFIHGYSRPAEMVGETRIRFREVVRGLIAVASSPSSIALNLLCASLVAVQYTAVSFLAIALITQKHAALTTAVEAMVIFQVGAILGRLVWGSVSDHIFGGDRIYPMLLISVMTLGVLWWLAQPGSVSALVIFLLAGALGFSAAAWNGLWAAAQAEIGGARHAGSALGASLTIIYIVGALVPPAFGALVDRTNFSVAWEALGIIVLVGFIPGFMAQRLMRQPA